VERSPIYLALSFRSHCPPSVLLSQLEKKPWSLAYSVFSTPPPRLEFADGASSNCGRPQVGIPPSFRMTFPTRVPLPNRCTSLLRPGTSSMGRGWFFCPPPGLLYLPHAEVPFSSDLTHSGPLQQSFSWIDARHQLRLSLS